MILSFWLLLKRQQITLVVKDVETWESFCTVGGIVNCCSVYGKQYEVKKWSCSVVSNSLRPHGLYSLPGSSVHGIFQARILEWVATSFSTRSSWPRDWTRVSCIVGRHFIRSFLKKLNMQLPYYLEIPLLSTDMKKTKVLIWKDICTWVHCSIIHKSQDREAT